MSNLCLTHHCLNSLNLKKTGSIGTFIKFRREIWKLNLKLVIDHIFRLFGGVVCFLFDKEIELNLKPSQIAKK